jgi:hypothetical protein
VGRFSPANFSRTEVEMPSAVPCSSRYSPPECSLENVALECVLEEFQRARKDSPGQDRLVYLIILLSNGKFPINISITT